MLQLRPVKLPICPHSGTEVDSERCDFLNCLCNIFGSEAARKKYWNTNPLANFPAQRPVVSLASTPKFFDREFLISRVEQYRINIRRHCASLIHGFGANHVDDLNNCNPRQGILEFTVGAASQLVADLDGACPAKAVLGNDVTDTLS